MSVSPNTSPVMIRGIGLWQATTLNMIDMVGVGPFITLPAILAAMGGPQAMLGWIFGAVISMCDGLVWAEFGAALPGSGGSYLYLREAYGPDRWGRLMSFLFIWMILFSAPLSVASGAIGFSQYTAFLWQGMTPLEGKLVAVGVVVFTVILLYRKITAIGKLSLLLWGGVILTVGWMVVAGLGHFNARQVLDFPPHAFQLSKEFFLGLALASRFAVYDYWGYYNICFLGDEVRDPGRTIPRAVLLSIAAVAAIYLLMNLSVISVIPWREAVAMVADPNHTHNFIASIFMERLYGHRAAQVITVLVMWTAFASVFSLLLGYSRIPYAAAVRGDFFKGFARLHPRHAFPYLSLIFLGVVAAFFSLKKLTDVISALVIIRVVIQFLSQTLGVMMLRRRRPDLKRPFRMWLYPIPAVIALGGWVFILFSRASEMRFVFYALTITAAGVLIFFLRAARRREWPFAARV
ncbi:MAG: amino acid permease [Acidobacteriia bacterium]|nr:amino acid permease [Terriglobia bacterium]